MGDITRPSYSEKDNTGTYIRMIGNMDRPERIKNKVDITISDKTNKTSILVSY